MMLRIAVATLGLALVATATHAQDQPPRPNVVIFLTDDQGYGDLSSFGHPTIVTPRIDQMAREGIRFTSFYAAPVCTPSRAQLLTGRYAVRSGLPTPQGPNSPVGIAPEEVTLGEALQDVGYRTAMIGKWHLGDFASAPQFNPLAHGFDEFFGLPYSHDYRPPFVAGAPAVPLYRGLEEVERPVDETTLTQRFTADAIRFIRESRDQPFFLLLGYTMPHLPVVTPPAFSGRSRAGRYGDAIEEIDWSVGAILDVLADLGLDERTLTVFFSDNGPWSNATARSFQEGQTLSDTGSAGPLRGTKATTWEGGMRVPAIIRWPSRIAGARSSADIVSELDLFPTIVRLAGGVVPSDRPMDGDDQSALLLDAAPSRRTTLYYFSGTSLEAIREGSWKLRLAASPPIPQLFDLDRDPGERLNLADAHPDVVERLRADLEAFRPEAVRDVGPDSAPPAD